MMTIYCPACGTTSELEPSEFTLSPGDINWTCPWCTERYRIQVEYVQEEE